LFALLFDHSSLQTDTSGQLNVFDASVVPHAALLLFAGNEILQSNPGKKKNARKSQRIVVNQWIEMELSELHLACYRKLAREIETVLRSKVELPHSDVEPKLRVIREALRLLLRNTEDDDDEDVSDEG
jgi:hypothetical protein